MTFFCKYILKKKTQQNQTSLYIIKSVKYFTDELPHFKWFTSILFSGLATQLQLSRCIHRYPLPGNDLLCNQPSQTLNFHFCGNKRQIGSDGNASSFAELVTLSTAAALMRKISSGGVMQSYGYFKRFISFCLHDI